MQQGILMFDVPLPFVESSFRAAKMTFTDHAVIKAVITCVVALTGGFDAVFLALAIAMFADLITGTWAAIYNNRFSCIRLRNAIGKWVVYFLLIVLAHQAANVSNYLVWMEEATALFIFLTEYNSVAGNLNLLGFKIPTFDKLLEFMTSFKRKGER